jgi:23S rRNA pseudouridine1911/1915/1917 synthase
MTTKRLDAVVRERFDVSWNKAREWIETGKIWLGDRAIRNPSTPTATDSELELKMNAPKAARAQSFEKSRVVHVDTQIIVVNKPAGMNTVPYGDEKESLEQLVCQYLQQRKVSVVQRLDRETSGLLVLARTIEAGDFLANQFRFRTVQRRYFALAQGEVGSQVIRTPIHSKGEDKPAVTHVEALMKLRGMTLIECKLETGRTHQIRIHLSEAGHPLLGERAYAGKLRGKMEAPRIMLHAAELGITHPVKKVPMRWTLLPPEDFLSMLPEEAHSLLERRMMTLGA